MVGVCVKRSPLPKVTPVRFPVGAICELSFALFLCCATRVFQTIWFSSLCKIKHLVDVAGSQWCLACLLLEYVGAASLAIQLLAASKDD